MDCNACFREGPNSGDVRRSGLRTPVHFLPGSLKSLLSMGCTTIAGAAPNGVSFRLPLCILSVRLDLLVRAHPELPQI